MPLIDNYLLDNYAIDGPSGDKYQSIIPLTANESISIPAGQTNVVRTIAEFPIGTKSISLAMRNSTAAYINCTSPSMGYALGLTDGTNFWNLMFDASGVSDSGGSTMAYINFTSIQIDLVSGDSKVLGRAASSNVQPSTATGWQQLNYGMPTGFNLNAKLSLVTKVIRNTNTTSTLVVSHNLANTIIVSS